MNPPLSSEQNPPVPDKAPVWKVSPAGGKYYINSVAVSADGGRVVGGTFYHHYAPAESRRAAAPAPGAGGQPSPDDGTFGVYCYDGAGRLEWKDEFPGWQGVYWVALSADGARAAAGGFLSASAPQGFVRAYDAADQGRLLLSRPTQQRVNQVALSGDGTWLVSAAETLLLFRFEATMGAYVQVDEFAPGGGNGIVSTALSADGLTVLYADYGGHLGVFANEAGRLRLRARWKVPGGAKADFCHMLALTPDGTAFAAGGANGAFYYSSVAEFAATGAPSLTDSTNVRGAVYGVAIAEDGSLFAGVLNSGAAGQAYLVPVPRGGAGTGLRHFALERNPNSAALSAAHRLFAIADGHPDGTPGHFYLFDPVTGALRWKFQTGNMSWPVVLAANGRAVVGGSDDSCIYYFTP